MESLRGGLSSRSPHRFPRFSQLEPFSLYNPPRVSFSSGRQAETALISPSLSSPSATSRDALFTAARRKKRFMILVSSSALVFVGSAAAPLPHFSRCNVSLHEFLANARDRWKQLFRAVGTTTVNKAGVLLRSNDSSIASACLPRCFSRHGAKRTIDRFADFALRLGSIFKRDVLTNGRNISSCLLSSFEVER